MLIANIKRILGLGSLLVLFLGSSLTINLEAAAAGSGGSSVTQAQANRLLWQAVENGDKNAVQAALLAGANIHSDDGFHRPALHI